MIGWPRLADSYMTLYYFPDGLSNEGLFGQFLPKYMYIPAESTSTYHTRHGPYGNGLIN